MKSEPRASKPAKPTPPPYRKHGDGVRAHGVVKGIRESHDGTSAHVDIRHGKVRKQHDGIFDSYPHESAIHMDKAAASRFPMGSSVEVHVRPRKGK